MMKKTATKKMTYGGAKTMSKGGKATAKPKMAGGGTKKYAMAGTTDGKPKDPILNSGNCKNGKCAPGTGSKKVGIVQRIKGMVNPGRIKKVRV